jgi:hypothetical protein
MAALPAPSTARSEPALPPVACVGAGPSPPPPPANPSRPGTGGISGPEPLGLDPAGPSDAGSGAGLSPADDRRPALASSPADSTPMNSSAESSPALEQVHGTTHATMTATFWNPLVVDLMTQVFQTGSQGLSERSELDCPCLRDGATPQSPGTYGSQRAGPVPGRGSKPPRWITSCWLGPRCFWNPFPAAVSPKNRGLLFEDRRDHRSRSVHPRGRCSRDSTSSECVRRLLAQHWPCCCVAERVRRMPYREMPTTIRRSCR